MKKLTLCTFTCRNRRVSVFVNIEPSPDGKYRVPEDYICNLFWEYFGFWPSRGETISNG